MQQLKYPIGTFSFDPSAGSKEINDWIADIDRLPDGVAEAVTDLNEDQLDTPYRPDGWTVRQVVHHLAHIISLIDRKNW